MVNWYPYPFINASVLTAEELLINVVVLTIAFIAVGVIFVFLNNLLRKK